MSKRKAEPTLPVSKRTKSQPYNFQQSLVEFDQLLQRALIQCRQQSGSTDYVFERFRPYLSKWTTQSLLMQPPSRGSDSFSAIIPKDALDKKNKKLMKAQLQRCANVNCTFCASNRRHQVVCKLCQLLGLPHNVPICQYFPYPKNSKICRHHSRRQNSNEYGILVELHYTTARPRDAYRLSAEGWFLQYIAPKIDLLFARDADVFYGYLQQAQEEDVAAVLGRLRRYVRVNQDNRVKIAGCQINKTGTNNHTRDHMVVSVPDDVKASCGVCRQSVGHFPAQMKQHAKALAYIVTYLLRQDETKANQDDVKEAVTGVLNDLYKWTWDNWDNQDEEAKDITGQHGHILRNPIEVIRDLWHNIFATPVVCGDTVRKLAEIMLLNEEDPVAQECERVSFLTVARVVFCLIRRLSINSNQPVQWETAERVNESCCTLLEALHDINERYISWQAKDQYWPHHRPNCTIVVGRSNARRKWQEACKNSRIAVAWTRGPSLQSHSCFTVLEFVKKQKIMFDNNNRGETFRKFFDNIFQLRFSDHVCPTYYALEKETKDQSSVSTLSSVVPIEDTYQIVPSQTPDSPASQSSDVSAGSGFGQPLQRPFQIPTHFEFPVSPQDYNDVYFGDDFDFAALVGTTPMDTSC